MRDVHQSPFKSIDHVDYSALASEMDKAWGIPTFYSPMDFPDNFRSFPEKQAWLTDNSSAYPALIKKLSITGNISDQSYIDFLEKNDPEALQIQKEHPVKVDVLANKKAHEIFGYVISNGKPGKKKNILIWAKEHADEFNASEFVLNFSDVVLEALSGKLDQKQPLLAGLVRDVFSKINLIVIPDVTPDENIESGINQDENFIGQFLQPFDYDNSDAQDFSIAPEAKYLKQVIDSTSDVALGIDIHSPYDVGTVLVEDPDSDEAAHYIVAEAEYARKCSAAIPNSWMTEPLHQADCKKGWIETDQLNISAQAVVSASYLSRTKKTPGIFLEIAGSKYSPAYATKYSKLWDLRENTPFLLRAFEIAGYRNP